MKHQLPQGRSANNMSVANKSKHLFGDFVTKPLQSKRRKDKEEEEKWGAGGDSAESKFLYLCLMFGAGLAMWGQIK